MVFFLYIDNAETSSVQYDIAFFNTIPHLTKAYTLPYEVLNVFLHILFIHVSNKISVNQSEGGCYLNCLVNVAIMNIIQLTKYNKT